DLPAVGGVGAGDALDEGGLPRAVVADERHHLAAPNLEVDLGQRLNRPERLRNAAKLENRGVCVVRGEHARAMIEARESAGGGAARTPPPEPERLLLAVLLVVADADLALLQEALREELRVVLLRDPLHGERLRRFLLVAVQPERVRVRLGAVQQRNRGGRGGV